MLSVARIEMRLNLSNTPSLCSTNRKNGWPRTGREIAARMEAGYASSQRGDLMDEEQVRLRMAARKQDWLAQQRDGK